MSIRDIARQAARSMKTYDGLDQVADAVAVATLNHFEAQLLSLADGLTSNEEYVLRVARKELETPEKWIDTPECDCPKCVDARRPFAEVTRQPADTDSRQVDGQLPYERFSGGEALAAAFARREGEHLLARHAFRWHLDGRAIPNCYEMFDREGIVRERGWEIVHTFGPHIAVVREERRKPAVAPAEPQTPEPSKATGEQP